MTAQVVQEIGRASIAGGLANPAATGVVLVTRRNPCNVVCRADDAAPKEITILEKSE